MAVLHTRSIPVSLVPDEKSMAKAMAAKGFAKVRARVPGYQGICYVGLALNSMSTLDD